MEDSELLMKRWVPAPLIKPTSPATTTAVTLRAHFLFDSTFLSGGVGLTRCADSDRHLLLAFSAVVRAAEEG